MEALDELLRLDLVRPTDVPRRFRFRHPLVRGAVYEATPGGWRLGAHERSAGRWPRAAPRPRPRAPRRAAPARHGDAAPSPSCARPARPPRPRARERRAAGSAPRCACSPTSARRGARRAAARARRRSRGHRPVRRRPRRAAREHRARAARTPAALRVRLTAACAGIEHLLGRHDEAHARLTGPRRARGPALARGRRADDRARGRRLLPRRVRRHERLGVRAVAAGAPWTTARALAAAVGRARVRVHRLGGGGGRARRAEAAALVDGACPTRSWRCASTPPPTSPAPSSTSTASTRRARTPSAAIAVGRATGPGRPLPGHLVPTLGHGPTGRGRLPEAAELLDGGDRGRAARQHAPGPRLAAA